MMGCPSVWHCRSPDAKAFRDCGVRFEDVGPEAAVLLGLRMYELGCRVGGGVS